MGPDSPVWMVLDLGEYEENAEYRDVIRFLGRFTIVDRHWN